MCGIPFEDIVPGLCPCMSGQSGQCGHPNIYIHHSAAINEMIEIASTKYHVFHTWNVWTQLLNYSKCSWQTCTSQHIKLISGDVSIISSSHTTRKPISLRTNLYQGTPIFSSVYTATNLYHYLQHFYNYIQHLYQVGLYISWCPHCPQTYITTYNTSITT